MPASVPSRGARQAETRRRLLAAAARTFASKGFHGASVSEIAVEAGYTTGALYANFAGKEALFIALIDEHIAAQEGALDDLGAAHGSAALADELTGRVEQLLGALIAGGRGPDTAPGGASPASEDDDVLSPAQLQTLTLEVLLYAVRHRPDLREALAERYRRIDARTAQAFGSWLDAHGHVAALDADDLALAHSWLVEGLALRLLVDPALTTPARAARLWRALVADLPVGGDVADATDND